MDDLVCFSHLPWNFVYQRPQHLLSRFTNDYRVIYIQEFTRTNAADGYQIAPSEENVLVVVPNLDNNNTNHIISRQRAVLDQLYKEENISPRIAWYYTPMSLLFSDHLPSTITIYDCMDELSAFKFADPKLKEAERALFERADIVFTGGNSLYEAKKGQHHNVYAFPSSIDKLHFGQARTNPIEYPDQAGIPHPRLGFFGVLDERFDIRLIQQSADLRPDWHFVLVGPVVKIDPGTLPQNSNIHYLGSKTYKELPGYLSGWDIALIPFAINESTRFISPTKTPEYLAAGKPVISTPITDVIYPYGEDGLVHIVDSAPALVEKASLELTATDRKDWLARVDDYLSGLSWDNTWSRMNALLQEELRKKQYFSTKKKESYV